MKVALAVVFVIAILKGVDSRPDGAPVLACDTLNPLNAESPHVGPAQAGDVPYAIDYAGLDRTNNSMLGYYPGRTYTITFAGTGDSPAMFRGVLVQTRTSADDSRVGNFTVTDANTRLSDCDPTNSGVTHTTNVDKMEVTFNWTAPMESTGPIRFRFAVVQMRDIFWADQSSRTVQEIGPDRLPVTLMPSTTATTAGAVKLSSVGFWSVLIAALVAAMKL